LLSFFAIFVIFYSINPQNISATHAATWWQKLAADLPSLKTFCPANGLFTYLLKVSNIGLNLKV
jgi:hypothetical protein